VCKTKGFWTSLAKKSFLVHKFSSCPFLGFAKNPENKKPGPRQKEKTKHQSIRGTETIKTGPAMLRSAQSKSQANQSIGGTAPSVEQVKEILSIPRPVVLQVSGSGLEELNVSSSSSAVTPEHPPDTLLFRFQGFSEQVIQVRKSHLYQDLNTAANFLNGTDHKVYTIQLFPVGLKNDVSMSIYAPEKCSEACVHQLSRAGTYDLHDAILWAEMGPPKDRSKRKAAALHPFSSFSWRKGQRPGVHQKGNIIAQAQKEADAEFHALYEAERLQHKQKHPETKTKTQNPELLEKLHRVLDPLLAAEKNQVISEPVLDAVATLVLDLGREHHWRKSLNQWAREASVTFGETNVFPVLHWLVGQMDELDQNMNQESEDEQGPWAFQHVPVEIENVELSWAQCDCCQKWRVLSRPLTETEAKQEFQCGQIPMSIQGMEPRIQDYVETLKQIRERLQRPDLSTANRESLQIMERAYCDLLCQEPEEDTEEARSRMAQFQHKVLENPDWNATLQALDRRVQAQEQAELEMQDLLAGSAQVEEDQEAEEAKSEKLEAEEARQGKAEDRKQLRTSDYLGDREDQVRDDIFFLQDLIESRETEIQELVQEAQEIKATNPDHPEALAELKAELTNLLDLQTSDRLRLKDLEITQEPDPMLPKISKEGEQNQRFVWDAILGLVETGKWVLQSNMDITPVANRLKQEKTGRTFGDRPAAVVYSLLDPSKSTFLGVRGLLFAAPMIHLEKGYFIPRIVVTRERIPELLTQVKRVLPLTPPDKMVELEHLLQATVLENQALALILGGAFVSLAQHEIETGNPGSIPIPDLRIRDLILQDWNQTVEHLKEQMPKKTRLQVLRMLLKKSQAETQNQTEKTRWWQVLRFPIVPVPIDSVPDLDAPPASVSAPPASVSAPVPAPPASVSAPPIVPASVSAPPIVPASVSAPPIVPASVPAPTVFSVATSSSSLRKRKKPVPGKSFFQMLTKKAKPQNEENGSCPVPSALGLTFSEEQGRLLCLEHGPQFLNRLSEQVQAARTLLLARGVLFDQKDLERALISNGLDLEAAVSALSDSASLPWASSSSSASSSSPETVRRLFDFAYPMLLPVAKNSAQFRNYDKEALFRLFQTQAGADLQNMYEILSENPKYEPQT